MNIIVFSGAAFSATGGGQMPTQLARQFAALGHQVTFGQAVISTKDDAMRPEGVTLTQASDWARYSDDFWSSEPPKGHLRLNEMPAAPGLAIFCMPSPFFTAVARALKQFGWRIVYYTLDDWSGFAEAGECDWWTPGAEAAMLEVADVVLATAGVLAAALPRCDAVIGNGYDPERFWMSPRSRSWDRLTKNTDGSETIKETITLPASSSVEPFRIGYWGHLAGAWFDWDLLLAISDAHPEWEIDLVGPLPWPWLKGPIQFQCMMRPNLKFHGEIPNEGLCDFAHKRGWRAGILPFKRGRILEAVSPIKGFEYLASGLPLVCPPMPETGDWPATFRIVESTGESWSHFIESASAHAFPWAAASCFLSDKSWAARAARILEVCDANHAEPVGLAGG